MKIIRINPLQKQPLEMFCKKGVEILRGVKRSKFSQENTGVGVSF